MKRQFKILKIKGRILPCQQLSALTDPRGVDTYSGYLIALWEAVEQATGYRWRATSYVRKSASHQHASALDIAPVIEPGSKHLYAYYQNSDPVLYKREGLIRQLQQLAKVTDPSPYDAGIYIEPDHLHLQLFKPESDRPQLRVFKWGDPKHIYPDTDARSKLPLIVGSGPQLSSWAATK